MKTEWTQEPHTTVRGALVEALRASDNASDVDYLDVLTENLIRDLKLRMGYAVAPDENPQSPFARRFKRLDKAQLDCRNRRDLGGVACHVTAHLVSDWKRVDSDG